MTKLIYSGPTKYIVGGNKPTGGVEDNGFKYSHSSYFKVKPDDVLTDNQGYYIDENGHRVNAPVNNPYEKEFEIVWVKGNNHNEPPRVSRRPNFLREYPNEKYLLT